MRRPALPAKRHNESQTDCDLRCRDGDDKKHEDLSLEIIAVSRKCHQGQVGGVEHQLQTHVDHQQIAPHDHAQQPETKQDHAHRQVMLNPDIHLRSFLLSKITPTIATNNSTEIISNGSRYWVNNNLPSGTVAPS